MTEQSYSNLGVNDKSSDDSYNNDDAVKGVFRNVNRSKKENVQKTTSKTDSTRSSQNDDRSDHYVRLLKESQQSVSNRDLLIGMLQRQLKKMEDLYKNTLDQQQDLRLSYSNALQELGHLKIVSNKLSDENRNLVRVNEENAARYRRERKILETEVEKWKNEYDHLLQAIDSMEKNTSTMKDILKGDPRERRKLNISTSVSMEKLLEHYVRIQEALAQQNRKLDTFLEKFEVIGDGGCTIINSLEGMKHINRQLTKSLESCVAERDEQSFEDLSPQAAPAPIFATLTEEHEMPEEDVQWLPEKQKKHKKNKKEKKPKPDDECDVCECESAHEEEPAIAVKDKKSEKRQSKWKWKSKTKPQPRSQLPEYVKSSCDTDVECDLDAISDQQVVLTANKVTMEESCYESEKRQSISKSKSKTKPQSRSQLPEYEKSRCDTDVECDLDAISDQQVVLTANKATMEESCYESEKRQSISKSKSKTKPQSRSQLPEFEKSCCDTDVECDLDAISDQQAVLTANKVTMEESCYESEKRQSISKSKSKTKPQSRSQLPEFEKSCCDTDVECDLDAISDQQAVLTTDNATLEESCCDSECSCGNFSDILNDETCDRGVNTTGGDYDDGLGGQLLHAAQEIDRLNALLAAKVVVANEAPVRLDSPPSQQEDNEDILKERDDLMEENVSLKAIITNLEEDVQKLTEDLDATRRDLEEDKRARAELEKELDSILKGYDVKMEDGNEKYALLLTKIDSLTDEKTALLEKINFLNNSVKQHKEQTCLCKMELEKLSTKAASLEDTLQNVQGDVRQKDSLLNEELACCKTNVAQITEAYNALKSDYDALLEDNKEIDLLKRKNANLVRELDQRDVIIYELREQVSTLEKELNAIREEMLKNSQTASHEMDVLMGACIELESKLESTKVMLEEEGLLIDEEVNTSNCCVAECTDSQTSEELNDNSDEKEEMRKLIEELDEARAAHQDELQALKNHIDLLQLQLERERQEHERDLEIAEERLRGAKTCVEGVIFEKVSSRDLGDTGSKSDLPARLEESQEENRTLREYLKAADRELKELRDAGKEFGVLKADNMKLKTKISQLEQQLAEMHDVEEKLSKLKIEKEELKVKVDYLEKQLSAARSLEKVSSPKKACCHTLATIAEEDAAASPNGKRPKTVPSKDRNNKFCTCEDTTYSLSTHVTILYDNKKFSKASNTDSVMTADSQQSTELPSCSAVGGGVAAAGHKLNKLQQRLANINQMEQQVASMIVSVRQQNERLNECNSLRIRNEKDIESRLHRLKHKRELLMNNLNTFQKEIQDLGLRSKDVANAECSHQCYPQNNKH